MNFIFTFLLFLIKSSKDNITSNTILNKKNFKTKSPTFYNVNISKKLSINNYKPKEKFNIDNLVPKKIKLNDINDFNY